MKKLFFVWLVFACCAITGSAQKKGVYRPNVISPAAAGETKSLSLPAITSFTKDIKNAKLEVRTDFGGDYKFGKPGNGADFSIKVDFTLKGYTGTNTTSPVFSKSYSLLLDNSHPEGYLSRDLRDRIVIPGSLTQTGLDIDKVEISAISVADMMGSGASYPLAMSSIRAYLSYEIEYKLDVRMKGEEIILSQVVLDASSPKTAVFTWNSIFPYPMYQFQLLRLYNTDLTKITTDQDISAKIDWSKAVTIETESDAKQLNFTVAEGTGFYTWRVRPIGTFYEGAVANSGNWGDWNNSSPLQGQQVTLPINGQAAFFFYLDPDDNKNYIYSRTFTEQNKIKESISYANSLLQEKQSQVYIPSDKTTVTTQTIQDNVGRPALKTMPVPVNGSLSGYKNEFAKTGNEIYSEKHFDSPSTINNPATIDNSSVAGSYYQGTANIPSAQGYPYNRIIFYDDGSGRIKEQSGSGKEHMVGDQGQGRGRTVKTIYSTPSQDELLAFFGSEAPNHESVQKIVTIDQNNTASITYQGKDGKVIATALSFLDNTNTNLLPLDTLSPLINVKDKLIGGVKTGDAYVSAKRIALTQATSFTPEYMIECKKFEQLCADIKLDCGYEVKVIIHNLENPNNDIVLSKVLKDLPCSNVTICGVTKKYMTIASSDWEINTDGYSLPLTLSPGTYVIEKKLISSGQVSVTKEHQEEKIKAQIDPIKNWLTTSLNNINCPDQLTKFYNNLITLGGLFASSSLQQSNQFSCENCEGGISFPNSFWSLYTNPSLQPQFQLKVYGVHGQITAVPFTDSPVYVEISTPCCATIKIDVTYSPPFKCPPPSLITNTPNNLNRNVAGDPTKLDVNYDFLTKPEKTEYFPDFEGYAISMLKECQPNRTDAEAKGIFYSFIVGWKEGEFNQMVFHMLTDQYSCKGTGNNAPPPDDKTNPGPVKVDACTPSSESMIEGTQYRCAELAKCWSSVVLALTESYCKDPSNLIDNMHGGGNVSKGVDAQNEGGQGPQHDSFLDNSLKNADLSGFVKFLAKLKLSKKLRNMQDANSGSDALPEDELPDFTFHLAEMFLNCTGYKFADILEPDSKTCTPLTCTNNCNIGVVGTFRIPADFDATNPALSKYNSCIYKMDGWPDKPVLNKADPTKIRKLRNLFPNIYNPIYAFKYFEYTPEKFPLLEAMTCYRDPNECWVLQGTERVTIPCCGSPENNPFCVKEYGHPRPDASDANGSYKLLVKDFCGMGKIVCPYTKKDWSCGQREYFFQLLKTYREPQIPFPEEPLTCSWMTEVKKWYQVPLAYQDLTTLDYIDRNQYKEFTGKFPEEIIPAIASVPLDGLKPTADGTKTDHLAKLAKEQISYAEYTATRKKTSCLERCDERKAEVRAGVLQMFVDRCYVFDGCKQTSEDNIVDIADIDKITNAIVAETKKQCLLTTYTCVTEDCREITTPYNIIGPNNSFSNLRLGVGGKPNTPNDCPAGIGAMKACCGNLDGNQVTLNGVDCNSAYNLSFYEYTNTKQAEGWHLELDIESKCNSNGIYVDADNDGRRDNYELYYFKQDGTKRLLVSQDPLNCQPRLPATTFVPKGDYEVNSNLPPDILLPPVRVESPKIKVVVPSH